MAEGAVIETTSRRIALFIDFENLVTNTGITAANFDIEPSLDRLLETGKVIFRRAYCDWSRFKEAKAHLHEFGVELVDVPPSTRAGKNGADMRLVIDALELNYAREHIDTFVIASGDSDFCPLAYKLRENNKSVIGLAVKEATSPFFVKACDEFIYLKPLSSRGDDAPQRGHRGRADRSPERGAGERPAPTRPGGAEPARGKRVIPDIAREVASSLLSRSTGPLNPSLIKETIVRKEPDFDERDHGFSTFSRLLEAMEKEGLCQRIQQGRQWYVVSRDGEAPATPGRISSAAATGEHEPAEGGSLADEEPIPDPDEP
jgi:uncharacterized LabA/DUF88 family protein